MKRTLAWALLAASFAVWMTGAQSCASVDCLPDDGPWGPAIPGAIDAIEIGITPEDALEADRRITTLIGL